MKRFAVLSVGVTVCAMLTATVGISTETASSATVGTQPSRLVRLSQTAPWLAAVNHYRDASGVPAVTNNPTWTLGISHHLLYLHNTDSTYLTGQYASAHTENPASPYYTADGAAAGGSSNLTFGSSSELSAIESWIAAPFHTIGILRPGLEQSAFARDSSGFAGLDVIRGLTGAAATSPVLFPGPNSTTQVSAFGGESPDPLETCRWTSAGLPVIALLPQAPDPAMTAQVVDEKGVNQQVCVVTENNYRSSDPIYGPTGMSILESDHAVLVVPRNPLRSTRYRATIHQSGMPDIAWPFFVTGHAADPIDTTGLMPIHVTDTPNATVLGNLTVTAPAGTGFTTAYPCTADRPLASNSNYVAGQTIANFAAVQSDANGDICVYTQAATHLIWDQVAESTTLQAGAPTRIFDSRNTGKLPIAGVAKIHVTATPNATVLGNLTVTAPAGTGFTTAYPCSSGRPTASNSNYVAGQTIANFAAVQADVNGDICVYTAAAAHLIWDQVAESTTLQTSAPTRVFDSRDTGKLPIAGVAKIHATDTPNATVLGNLTVTAPAAVGFTTAYPCTAGRPTASNSNYVAGQTIANFAAVQADVNGDICVYTAAAAHLIWDQVAQSTTLHAGPPTRIFDSRVN